jgi:hypothetical protein
MPNRPTILVTACGSSIGLEVLRCLKLDHRNERIIGTEVSAWGKQLALPYCDKVIILPRGDEPEYVYKLKQVFESENVALAFINTEPELEAIYPIRDQIQTRLSCPAQFGLTACLSKQVLHDRLYSASITAKTMVVDDARDLETALQTLGSPVWLRCAVGPRGRGSIVIKTAAEGAFWIEYWRRQNADESPDVWLAHQYLPGRNLNWTSVWNNGQLVAAAAGERLKYFMAEVAISGVTGNVSRCQIIDSSKIQDTAIQAVTLADDHPHGIYAVDLREDINGKALVTEINARNAFRPLLYAAGGVNFPAILIASLLGPANGVNFKHEKITLGLEMVRGMDFAPMFRETSDAPWRALSYE